MNDIGSLPARLFPFGSDQVAPENEPRVKRDKPDTGFAKLLEEPQGKEPQAAVQANHNLLAPANGKPDRAEQAKAADARQVTSQSENAPTVPLGNAATETNYNAETDIGDSAVSFGARPIVGPTSTQHSREEPLLADPEISAPELADLQAKMASQLETLEQSAAPSQRGVGTFSQVGTMAPIASTPAQALSAAQGPIAPRSVAAPIVAPISNQQAGQAQSIQSPQKVTAAATARFVPTSSAQTPAFAQLLASPSEYRLIIRGQKLSESEREHLMREINSALMQLGLPFHPVHMTHQDGEA